LRYVASDTHNKYGTSKYAARRLTG
jgi:hypothetical protein